MDGLLRVVGEVTPSGARECTHPWNPAPVRPVPRCAACFPLCSSVPSVVGYFEAAGPAPSSSTLNQRGNPAPLLRAEIPSPV